MDIPVGTLVAPSPRFRASMGTGEGAAVLIALRRGNGSLYYAADDRSFWVPMRDVRPIPPEVVPEASLERVLSDLILFVEADECTIDEAGEDGLMLALETPGVSRERFEGLRERLGASLADFAFEPRSMNAVKLRVALVDLPPAVGAGR